MAGNKRGSGSVRVRRTAATAVLGRTPDLLPRVCRTGSYTYTQNASFRFEPYVNPAKGDCPEE
ncbi:hypothetical protein GCM10017752_21900 [Streptomyces roseoviridis]